MERRVQIGVDFRSWDDYMMTTLKDELFHHPIYGIGHDIN